MADVRFENITFHYGDKCILKNFSLSVEESQIMCLVGPSGCGKTTLVRCLLGFIKPETGSIYVGDKCLFSAEKKINVPPEYRHIGVVFQDYAVWPHMTVLEEAHNLFRRTNTVQMQESANIQGKSVEMLSNAVAEMRSYGEGIIVSEQIPTKLAPDVIKNSSNKIVHRLASKDDQEIMQRCEWFCSMSLSFSQTLKAMDVLPQWRFLISLTTLSRIFIN